MHDPNATVQAELCPQCRTPREGRAPFCGECGYAFPPPAAAYNPPAPPAPSGLLPPGFQQAPRQTHTPPPPYQAPQPPHAPEGYPGPGPVQGGRPPEPFAPRQPQQPQQPQGPYAPHPQSPPPPPGQSFGSAEADWMLRPPAQTPQHPQPPHVPQPPQHLEPPQHHLAPQSPQSQSPQPPQHHHQPHQHASPQPPPHAQASQQHYAPQGPQPVQGPGWVAVVAPDPEYFTAMMGRSGPEASGLSLPAYVPEQQHPLTGGQLTIGRRRNSTGESPDVDLSQSPEDPGVSHQHAVLAQQPDGSWAVVDQDSTNGTTINGSDEPIQPFVPVPLKDGDRVHVGAWTTITLRRG